MFQWRKAQIDQRKIVEYLLATEHPVGGAKAAFFVSLGYSSDEWTRLRDDLAHVAEHGEVVDGVVESPCGRMVELRTVWISDKPGSVPQLVTAYPS